jgi:hypothetical protein
VVFWKRFFLHQKGRVVLDYIVDFVQGI